uniref:Uncharacterized protein n=1 Tax=Quercus lobata TaxID=97700 RepID=A0A7N2MNA8_QUELO
MVQSSICWVSRNWLTKLHLLIDQALDKGVKVAVCSTSNEKVVCIISCVVVEDSAIGLAAAKAAGMKCIITKSGAVHLVQMLPIGIKMFAFC